MTEPLFSWEPQRIPNIQAYGGTPGRGPKDKRCKHCAWFIRHRRAKTYFKCGRVRPTAGPGTDIRANMPACENFKEADDAGQ